MKLCFDEIIFYLAQERKAEKLLEELAKQKEEQAKILQEQKEILSELKEVRTEYYV
jgi:hypothetical protein